MILRGLGEPKPTIEHFGSTAVPALLAKPVVDILIGIHQASQGEAVAAALDSLSYQDLGEAGVPGRIYFRKRIPNGAYNAHMVPIGGDLWRGNLLFRDYLRTHPNEASSYQAVKVAAVHTSGHSLIEYSGQKRAFISEVLRRARASTTE